MDRILRSKKLTELGFKHGFSLRSLLEGAEGIESAQSPNRVRLEAGHYRAMAEAVGYEPGQLYEVEQVHGAVVRSVRPGDLVAETRRERADALVAGHAPCAVAVRVADCLALLLADPGSGAVAAVHAGWRGVVARVVPATVQLLCLQAGTRPERLFGAIFPHIRRCCFEVGRDVAEQLAAVSPGLDAVDVACGRFHVELAAIVRGQLRVCGVTDQHIEDLGGCTRCEPERFFSYRRDRAGHGRHLAAIAARAK